MYSFAFLGSLSEKQIRCYKIIFLKDWMEISIAIIFVLDMEKRFCFGLYKNIVIWRVRTYRDQGIGTCQLNNLNQFLKKRGGSSVKSQEQPSHRIFIK